MERKGILAGGNYIVDHVKVIDAWPEQDGLAMIFSQRSGNGGGPYNVLKDLARMGVDLPLAAVGLVGNDANGDWILEDCRKHGIDTGSLTQSPDLSTSYTEVMSVQSTGRRTFFHQKGANARLAESHFDFSHCAHRLFYLGYFMLLDTLDEIDASGRTGASRVLEAARNAGLLTIADSVSVIGDHVAGIVKPSLPYLDYFILNELEAEQITGLSIADGGDVEIEKLRQAAFRLIEMGVKHTVVIHCSDAAVAASRGGQFHTVGSVRLPADRIVGANGAGDAFAAGLLYAVHEGWEIPRALELAACVAASGLLSETTSDGVLPLDDCLALGEQYGYREA